jgi:glycogen synthase
MPTATSLSGKDIKVTFVVPKLPFKPEVKEFELTVANEYTSPGLEKYWVETSKLQPYYTFATPQSYQKNGKSTFEKEIYGRDLIKEVEKYGLLITEWIKGRKFDVIHAHDWMTAIAAQRAKEILQIPLIVHIHSTEYDHARQIISFDSSYEKSFYSQQIK